MLALPFGHLAFLNPWLLTGLLALPLLWFLLRVFPPAPRLMHLPGAWLLQDLVAEQQTPSKTPWWILLLRIILTALILLALAHPVINPAERLHIPGALRLVIDNDWAAAQTWTRQMQTANEILAGADRDRTETYILTTAPEPGQAMITQQGPMTAAEARTIVHGLKPHLWPSDYAAVTKALRQDQIRKSIHSFWLSTGIDNGQGRDLAAILQQHGGLTYIEPDPLQRPLLLLPHKQTGQALSVAVNAVPGFTEKTPVSIAAIANDGRILDQQTALLQSGSMPAEVKFVLPDALRGQVSQFHLSGRAGAGAVLLLDTQFNRKSVGIVTARDESKSAPLIESGYYLLRALEPYADLHDGTLEDLLKRKDLSVIIMPDIGGLPAETLEQLHNWVKAGGLLLRTAGPNMSKAENFLVPVPLRQGERALNGALTWDKPQTLAAFPKTSPLYGLDLPPDVEIRQQILPESVADTEGKTWAALADGTPLVTAAPLEKGLLVLLHTSATPQWSNLALSGLYVQMLQRIVGLAGQQNISSDTDGTLHPQKILNGIGALIAPDSTVQPIDAKNFAAQIPDPTHPPGLYGRTGVTRTLNIGDRIKTLTAMPDLPSGTERRGYTHGHQTDLMPWLLAAAFALFLIDWLIMLLLQQWLPRTFRRVLQTFLLVSIGMTTQAKAQDISPDAVKQASAIHLAYIASGQPEIDRVAQKGLENLSRVLTERTSVEPAGVVALNPDRDDLSFFPLIYWPIAGSEHTLSQNAAQKVQFYLDHGGTILFDTRDHGADAQAGAALKMLTGNLDVPPLIQAPDTHVLTKSFYLLHSFPGRYDSNTLWIEEQSANGRDGVSSIIVGGNDWASAWAGVAPPEDSDQQETALRFGVNLMMYALTGNYKADQVHVPYILERLRQ